MDPRDLPALADVVLRLADVCAELAVPYAIGGAVATSFWGVPRTTQDADCLVAVPAVAYQRLADALNGRGFEIEQSSGPQPVTVVALLEQVRKDKFMSLSCRATSVELFVPVVPLQESILKRAVERLFHGKIIKLPDPVIAAAIRTIRERAVKGLDIAELVEAAKLSRWQLEDRFRRAVGRSIHDDMLRVRLNEARRLITTTDLPLKHIAP